MQKLLSKGRQMYFEMTFFSSSNRFFSQISGECQEHPISVINVACRHMIIKTRNDRKETALHTNIILSHKQGRCHS
jgi:hypothetical protein